MRTVLDKLAFAEGPRWHDGAFWFSDMHAHKVHRVGDDGVLDTVLEHDHAVSGLGWLPDGRLLVVDMDGALLRQDPDGVNVHADLTPLAKWGVNDMVTHAEGWSYIGQFGFDRHQGPQGACRSPLLRVDVDGELHAEAAGPGMFVANGMAITPDGRTLLVAETSGGTISAFRIGDDGSLHDHRIWARLPEGRLPDGMCLDAEGAVWVACVMGKRFDRLHEGGAVTESIVLAEDGRWAIACMLGGPDLRTLYLLTASTPGREDEALDRWDARIETTEVDVPGAGWPA
jgi:sugar lactone lactonase YvrE